MSQRQVLPLCFHLVFHFLQTLLFPLCWPKLPSRIVGELFFFFFSQMLGSPHPISLADGLRWTKKPGANSFAGDNYNQKSKKKKNRKKTHTLRGAFLSVRLASDSSACFPVKSAKQSLQWINEWKMNKGFQSEVKWSWTKSWLLNNHVIEIILRSCLNGKYNSLCFLVSPPGLENLYPEFPLPNRSGNSVSTLIPKFGSDCRRKRRAATRKWASLGQISS